MLVHALYRQSNPLMPTAPPTAQHLLTAAQAKVVQRGPFTIKLLNGTSSYRQEIAAGMDTGSKVVGCAAIADDRRT